MRVRINGQWEEVEEGTSLADLARRWQVPDAGAVIAVNGDIVPKEEWDKVHLQEGQDVDVVTAMAGGQEDEDVLWIAGEPVRSRLWVGTGKYRTVEEMQAAIAASETDVVTVSVRYMDPARPDGGSILPYLDRQRVRVLPNTAGATTVEQAVRMAKLARALLGTNWIKLEVIGDPETLWPDVEATVQATRILVQEGFVVLPYTSPDLVAALRLEEAGAATVMPLASPIGTGQGFQDWQGIRRIVRRVGVPVVVDAGIGSPADAAIAMELGAAAVLVNTAIARAQHPARMARAMCLGVRAGREGFLAGRMPPAEKAEPSSPVTGVVGAERA